MTLATRCSACGTVFRVVQDQLRVSEGWVRCGRCNEVFNAVEQLVDLARYAPAMAAPPPAPSPPPPPHPVPDHDHQPQPGHDHGGEPPAPAEHPSASPEPAFAIAAADGAADIAIDVDPAPPAPISVHGSWPPAAADESIEAMLAARRSESEVADFDAPRDAAPAPDVAVATDDERAPIGTPADTAPMAALRIDPPDATPPSFLQAAERAQRWQRPALRRTLAVLALLLATGLVLQVALEYRDMVAARWPATRPLLESMCRFSNCRIEPPRWIDALAVDSSGLVRIEGTQTYRLSVVLHNRSALAIALPSVDLTLTDLQGRIIARRAFLASELGSSVTTVAPASELPLAATLSIADRPVAGYTIEIFYP